MANAKHIVRKLIENNEDLDSPEGFGVNQFIQSPVAKIAASNGFKRDDANRSDERWVKKLSNGKEAWLRTSSPDRSGEDAMNFQNPSGRQGGRVWELVEMTPTNVCSHCNQDRPRNKKPCPVCKQNAKINSFNKFKGLLSANEVTMSYVLGAFLQRLATWPEGVSKDFEESTAKLVRAKILEGLGIDDPDDAENVIKREVAARNWEGILLRNGFKQRDIGIRGYERKFGAATMVNVSNSTKPDHVLIGVYGLNTHGRWQCDGNEAILIRDMVDYINDYVPTAHLQENEVPVPDPDDPNVSINSLIKARTPNLPDYAEFARFIEQNKENVYISGWVTRNSRYVHENSTNFEMEVEGPSEIVTEQVGALADRVQDQIGDEIVRINRKIYRALEREWDYMNSDSHIDELLEEDESTVYNALGGVWDDEDEDAGEAQFAYTELSDSAKSQAIEGYRLNVVQHMDEWWDYIYEEWQTELEEMGFDEPKIEFSGFGSQGDGASFTARGFNFMKWAEWFMSNKPRERGHPYTDDLPREQIIEADLDDPASVLPSFEPRYHVIAKVGPLQATKTFWGGRHGVGHGWHNSPLDVQVFTQAEAEAEAEYLIHNYMTNAGYSREKAESRIGTELVSPALMDRWKKQRERNAKRKAARHKAKSKLTEAVPVPDPDDPQSFMKQYLKTHFDQSALLAVYEYINDHQFASAPCPACDGMGGADEGMGAECEACEGSGEVADGSFDHVATLWNKAGAELRELFKRIAVNEKKLFGKVKPPQNKAIARLFDYLNQGPNGSYEEVGLLSHRAGSDIERAIDKLRKLDLKLGAQHESLDEPSKDMLIHMGRAGDCEHHCHVCGAYCTLRHYSLPSGVQVPPYHICQQCDVRTAKLGDEHDLPDENGPAGLAGPDGPVDDNMIEVPRADNAAAGLRESDPDDPGTFMQSLDKAPAHEMIHTSNPPPSNSRSYMCACGRWSFSGLANNAEEQAAFDAQALSEYERHAQMGYSSPLDTMDKMQARNWVTSFRLKEDADTQQRVQSVYEIAERFLDELGEGQIESIWLIGSRGSQINPAYPEREGKPHAQSDWDWLIVGDGFDAVEQERIARLERGQRIFGMGLDVPVDKRSDYNDFIFSSTPPESGIQVWPKPVQEAYDFPDQGEQDKAEHWADDPEPDVDDPASVVKQEVAKRSEPINKLEIQGRRWYRRGAGGVYCTAHIYINDKLVHVTPEQYGYGDMYLTHAKNWLTDNGYFNGLLGDKDPIWFLRDKKIIPQLLYYVTDVKRERDLW